jgi:hypothetical protein
MIPALVKMTVPVDLIVMAPVVVIVVLSNGQVQPAATPDMLRYQVDVVHTTAPTPVQFLQAAMQHAKKHVPIVVVILYIVLIFRT